MNISETEKETHGDSEILIGTYSHLIQRCNLMTLWPNDLKWSWVT